MALTVGAVTAACGGAEPAPPAACRDVGASAMHASVEGRWLLGVASRYPADTALAARAPALRRSQRERRAAAWAAVARVLAPVPVAHPTPGGATLPRFRTWYDREDVYRTFQRVYGALTPAAREAGARFTDQGLDDALGWNARAVTDLPEWPSSRLDAFAASFGTGAALAAASGVQRVGLSPDAVRHVMTSYPEVLRCIADGAPPAFADGTAAPQQMAREPFALPPCGARTFGPYFVAAGARLSARVAGAADASLEVLAGVAPDAPSRCAAAAAGGCDVAGPGTFTVRVAARGYAAGGTLDVRYAPPDASGPACLQGPFPPAAATVAMEWRRADIGEAFPVFDTSAAGLARRLAPGATGTWGEGDGAAEPGEGRVYTLHLASGGTFRLAAMHLRTRELDRWLNVTLWWSPTPDEDFGADRPEAVRALGAPWSNYKMCVATDFDELDPDPGGGFDRDAPTLAASLRAVHEGSGGPSWCSNPYIDAGPGLVRSNCVGCHQHAMSGVRPADVQNDPARYPANARAQVRNNFPADGFWGLDGGDRLAAVLAETVDYHRASR